MIEIRNLFHEGWSPADLRYKEEERKRPGEIAEKTAREECTLDWSQSKVFLVQHMKVLHVGLIFCTNLEATSNTFLKCKCIMQHIVIKTLIITARCTSA